MTRHEIILIVASVFGSAIAFALPLVTLLWRAFGLISGVRMELSQLRNRDELFQRDFDDLDEKIDGAVHQTVQRIDHLAERMKGEVKQLDVQVREIQGFLTKTTVFEVRSR